MGLLDALLENQLAWPLGKVPEVAHTLSFYPRGAKLSLFSLYWAAVSDILVDLHHW